MAQSNVARADQHHVHSNPLATAASVGAGVVDEARSARAVALLRSVAVLCGTCVWDRDDGDQTPNEWMFQGVVGYEPGTAASLSESLDVLAATSCARVPRNKRTRCCELS